jgi:putative NADH-flavin reductase
MSLHDQKILLLGATGKTGVEILTQRQDKPIVSLIRNPAKIPTALKNEHFVIGSPENKDDLKKALDGVKTVISVLNNSPLSTPDN